MDEEKPTCYLLIADRFEYPKGQYVFRYIEVDYGISSGDTRSTGIKHISVTLDPEGRQPPFFTVPMTMLEEVAEPPKGLMAPPPLNRDWKECAIKGTGSFPDQRNRWKN